MEDEAAIEVSAEPANGRRRLELETPLTIEVSSKRHPSPTKGALRLSPGMYPSPTLNKKVVQFGEVVVVKEKADVKGTKDVVKGGGDAKVKKKKKKAVKLRFLIKACKGETEDIQRALDANADPNECDSTGRSVLSVAISKDFSKVIKLLVDRSADLNACDDGRVECTASGLEEGGNCWDNQGITALSAICFKGQQQTSIRNSCDGEAHLGEDDAIHDSIQTLLQLDADPSITDKIFWNPLHYAAFSNTFSAVDLLIEHKASVKAKVAKR
eukprot:jgi/Bigna1/144592/aug1.89_g19300